MMPTAGEAREPDVYRDCSNLPPKASDTSIHSKLVHDHVLHVEVILENAEDATSRHI